MNFTGKLAVVTGGGAGMGAELARQLTAQGCHVAICDVSQSNLDKTVALCQQQAPDNTRISAFTANVAKEADLLAFRDHVRDVHGTEHLDLLFNNAGIGGGGYSFVADTRERWEEVFNVNWGGVYLGVRTFLPMLLASAQARIVNMSSVNGFWAGLSATESLVAYSTAKFAVRGFTEALITDLRLRAPHIEVSVVMPGYIGTSLVRNSMSYLDGAGDADVAAVDASFQQNAPMSAEAAATTILDGVHAGKWRILVGEDAAVLDQAVRDNPEAVYEPEFFERMTAAGVFATMPKPPAAVN